MYHCFHNAAMIMVVPAHWAAVIWVIGYSTSEFEQLMVWADTQYVGLPSKMNDMLLYKTTTFNEILNLSTS